MDHGYTPAYMKFENDLINEQYGLKRQLDEAIEAEYAKNRMSVYDWKKQYYQSMADMVAYDKEKRFKPPTFVYGKRKPAFVPKPLSGPRKYNSVSGYSYGDLVPKPVIRKYDYVPKPPPRKYNVVNVYGIRKPAYIPKKQQKYQHISHSGSRKSAFAPPPPNFKPVFVPASQLLRQVPPVSAPKRNYMVMNRYPDKKWQGNMTCHGCGRKVSQCDC